MEYFFNDKYNVIDGDLNNIYMALNNTSFASFSEIADDPFIALRTKVYGIYGKYNSLLSWKNSALFIYRKNLLLYMYKKYPRFVRARIGNPDKIPDLNNIKWMLFPGETIIYHYNESPEFAGGRSDIAAWEGARETALGNIEMVIKVKERLKNRQSSLLNITTAYPIYKIVNPGTGSVIELHKGDPVTKYSLNINEGDDEILVYCYGARSSFPFLTRGQNTILLKEKNGQGELDITFTYSLPNKNFFLPEIRVINSSSQFTYESPIFLLNETIGTEKIWWQISDEKDFIFIIPNFETVEDFSTAVTLTKISETFFIPDKSYYFRIKGFKNGFWGEWSPIFKFKVIKPRQPENVEFIREVEGKIKIQWQSFGEKDLEYFVFGSNRLDFIPEIYNEREITEMINSEVIKSRPNKNLLHTTKNSYSIVKDIYNFYRIIARKRKSFSIPSAILKILPPPRRKNSFHIQAKVLQTRHSFQYGEQFKNGYRDIYHAEESDL